MSRVPSRSGRFADLRRQRSCLSGATNAGAGPLCVVAAPSDRCQSEEGTAAGCHCARSTKPWASCPKEMCCCSRGGDHGMHDDGNGQRDRLVHVEAIYLDRHPVTNRAVPAICRRTAATRTCRCGTRRSGRPCSISLIAPGIPARVSGKRGISRRVWKIIRWWASVGTKVRPSPAGPESACPPIRNGSKPVVGRS